MNEKKQLYRNRQAGYSLIELVVVLALFLIISGVVLDIFISLVQYQKRTLESQELLNQSSYAMEYMSKSLRTALQARTQAQIDCMGGSGFIYVLTRCTDPDNHPCNGVKFISQTDGSCDEFYLDTTTDPTHPALKEIKDGGTPQYLLSTNVKINALKFIIDGYVGRTNASDSDHEQPFVTFMLDISTPSNQFEKRMQTSVSARNPIR